MSVEVDVFTIITWYKIQEFNFLLMIFQRGGQERAVDMFNDKDSLLVFVCVP